MKCYLTTCTPSVFMMNKKEYSTPRQETCLMIKKQKQRKLHIFKCFSELKSYNVFNFLACLTNACMQSVDDEKPNSFHQFMGAPQ